MNMSLQEYQQQGAGFDIPDFWYLQTCYKFLELVKVEANPEIRDVKTCSLLRPLYCIHFATFT